MNFVLQSGDADPSPRARAAVMDASRDREAGVSTWLRRIRGVLGMGLIWAVGGLAIGGLFELLDNVLPMAHPFTRQVHMYGYAGMFFGRPTGVVIAASAW